MAKMQRGKKKNQNKAKKKKSKPNFKPTDDVGRNSESSHDEDTEQPMSEEAQNEMVEEPVEPQQHPCGQPVFFTDLPDKYYLGNVPLYAVGPMPLLRCDVCSSYSVRAVVSKCCHRFCENCVRLSQLGRGTFCHYCRKQFKFELLELPDEAMDQTVVQCRCGFEGPVREVRVHLASRGGRCQDSTQPLLNVLAADRSKMKTEKWKNRCKYLSTSSDFYRKDVKPPENCDEFLANCPRNRDVPHVYIDLDADGIFIGRIYVELRSDVVPYTVARFLDLIRDAKGYKGSEVDLVMDDTFFRIKRFPAYGSAPSAVYPDENFQLKHDKAGTLSMANHGLNTSKDGFYISNKPMPWRDGVNVVFGYVLSGVEVVTRICGLGRDDGTCSRRVRILDCGIIKEWMLPSIIGGSD